MPNESLIERLAADLRPVRARSWRDDVTVIGLVCIVELACFFALGFWRDRMPGMMPVPMPDMPIDRMDFWWKLASMLVIAVVSGGAALLSFRPTFVPGRAIAPLAAIIAGVFATGWGIDAAHGSPGHLLARLDWRNGVSCASKMALLAVPAATGLGVLMRRGAAVEIGSTALLAGLGAAAWGAFVFVFACPSDDPFYIVVWYSVGCGAITLIARLLLPRLCRW